MGRKIFLTILFGALAGCATVSPDPKVEKVSDGQAVLRMRGADGATTGQAFEVYRYVMVPYGNPSKQPLPSYRRESVGCVQVTQVVDAHHAKASILHGDVEARDYAHAGGASCPLPEKG